MRQKTKIFILAVLFALSLCLTLYPLVSNWLGEKNRSIVQSEYHEAVQSMDDLQLDEELKKARDYNGLLAPGASDHEAYTRESITAAGEAYHALLNIRGDSIMGYVEIPRIEVSLPIYHGTEDTALNKGVGHLLGSSLPVGGESTHSVLTGHSGLAGHRMFSELDQLKEGDVFYIDVLGEVIAYEVDAINTVLPEDTSKLGIEYMKDHCTLVTCTPYGVNTHRLLVRGHRIAHEEAVQLIEETAFIEEEVISSWTDQYILGLVIGGIFLTVLLLIPIIRAANKEDDHYENEA